MFRLFINLWIFPINYKRRVKRSCFELGNGKQQGQLETTTFREVQVNSPARRSERKRGVSVLVSGLNINHGLSRTRLTNARLELGRSCFYSCSGCSDFSSDRAGVAEGRSLATCRD